MNADVETAPGVTERLITDQSVVLERSMSGRRFHPVDARCEQQGESMELVVT